MQKKNVEIGEKSVDQEGFSEDQSKFFSVIIDIYCRLQLLQQKNAVKKNQLPDETLFFRWLQVLANTTTLPDPVSALDLENVVIFSEGKTLKIMPNVIYNNTHSGNNDARSPSEIKEIRFDNQPVEYLTSLLFYGEQQKKIQELHREVKTLISTEQHSVRASHTDQAIETDQDIELSTRDSAAVLFEEKALNNQIREFLKLIVIYSARDAKWMRFIAKSGFVYSE